MENDKCFFNSDPSYMKSLIGKSVNVQTVDNKNYNGVVYVIDPESQTIILATKTTSKGTNLDFILYHSITNLEVISSSVVNDKFLFTNKSTPLDNMHEMEGKKARLKAWLKHNLIDVEEDGMVLKLNNQLRIEYPYGPDQCLCTNTIVLDRIRTIIQNMPVNYS